MVILCTDHGHYLGEHDVFGKPGIPIYNTLGHIPLMVAWPGVPAGTTDALTTNVDLFATLADLSKGGNSGYMVGLKTTQRTPSSSRRCAMRGPSTSPGIVTS